MPLPLFLGIGAAVAGAAGIGTAIHGASKMKEANDTMKLAQSRHSRNVDHLEKQNKSTSTDMDKLGELELEILHSFSTFSDVFERIKNRPSFAAYNKNDVTLPEYDGESIKEVSVGAGVLLGGLGGAALGTAGGFAAAGATTAAVMALGTASTGTAIASLSGAALTNATLAALGGGAIAAGGGGIALGTTILGATTLGVGLLVGGIIFGFTGSKLSDKADDAYYEMKKAEDKIEKICAYLQELQITANKYYDSVAMVNDLYKKQFNGLNAIVTIVGHDDWDSFTDSEKKVTENTVLLVGLLYNMCKVELVLKTEESDLNEVNVAVIDKAISDANTIIADNSIK